MFGPDLCAWIEQRRRLARRGIDSRGRTRLAQIAVPAGQTKVIERVIAIWVNVIDVHRLTGDPLRGLAVFTQEMRSLVHTAYNIGPG